MSSGRYHFLGDLLGDVFVELEQELDGVVVFVFPVQLLVVIHPEPQLQRRLHAVVVLGEIHVDAELLLEEPVIQQVLNREPAERTERRI